MGKATATKGKVDREAPLVRAKRELSRLVKELGDGSNRVAAVRLGFAIADAKRKVFAIQRIEAGRGIRGTLESHEQNPPERRQSPLARMYDRGEISDDQFQAYREIERISEVIKRGVDVRSASIEARVDNGRGDRDVLVESLALIRLERAFTVWRDKLPMPRQMILDVIETNRALAATARVYRKDEKTIRKWVKRALDSWADDKAAAWKNIDAEDVRDIYARLGCGDLLPPKAKTAI